MKTILRLSFGAIFRTSPAPSGPGYYGFAKIADSMSKEQDIYFCSKSISQFENINGIIPTYTENSQELPEVSQLIVGITGLGGKSGHRFNWWMPACNEFKILVDLLQTPSDNLELLKKKEKLKKLSRIGKNDYVVIALAFVYDDFKTLVELQKSDPHVETILCNITHHWHRIDIWDKFVRECAILNVPLSLVSDRRKFDYGFNNTGHAFADAQPLQTRHCMVA